MERFTISLEEKLAQEFDAWIAKRSYANRSEAVRDLLRAELERSRLANTKGSHCVACLSYVYNHHQRDLAERLASLQHAQHDLIISSMHVHLDHEHCLETVLLQGSTATVEQLANVICAERGVHHGKLNLISVEVHQRHRHGRGARSPSKTRGRSMPHLHLKPSH